MDLADPFWMVELLFACSHPQGDYWSREDIERAIQPEGFVRNHGLQSRLPWLSTTSGLTVPVEGKLHAQQ